MSERGQFRGGGRSGGGGGGHRGGRGGGGNRGGTTASQTERPKKENILDLTKYLDKQVNVKFNGGRESEWSVFRFERYWYLRQVVGTLKGYDQLMNLVLDEVKETMRGT
jgi:U6 snRNA-associated Sm-like protein LSm7